MLRLFAVFTATLWVSGCGRQVFVAPPPQRAETPHILREVLDITGGQPAQPWGFVISGVHSTFEPSADWRWAAGHSLFQFQVDEYSGWNLAVRLTAAKAVVDKVGPQHVSFEVNKRVVGSATLDASRTYNLSFPMDAETMKAFTPIIMTMDAGPCLEQQYGPPFCVLLHSIGFVKELR